MFVPLNRNYLSLLIIVLTLLTAPIFAGCGSCEVKTTPPNVEKSNALITTIPKSGAIEGFTIASCGMCNFDYKEIKGCSLTIKIGDKVYPVEGNSIHDHGDPHGNEGFCFAVRVAYVSGKIKKGKFYSDSFTLIESPN